MIVIENVNVIEIENVIGNVNVNQLLVGEQLMLTEILNVTEIAGKTELNLRIVVLDINTSVVSIFFYCKYCELDNSCLFSLLNF